MKEEFLEITDLLKNALEPSFWQEGEIRDSIYANIIQSNLQFSFAKKEFKIRNCKPDIFITWNSKYIAIELKEINQLSKWDQLVGQLWRYSKNFDFVIALPYGEKVITYCDETILPENSIVLPIKFKDVIFDKEKLWSLSQKDQVIIRNYDDNQKRPGDE